MDYPLILSIALSVSVCCFSVYNHLRLTSSLETKAKELSALQEKYRLNPSYDAQLVLGELLTGAGLFRVERIESENLFYLRK